MYEIESRLAASPLAAHAASLLRFARPAIELRPTIPVTRRAPGGTRFGGLPDVGPGFRWPRDGGAPLSLLLQLDLAELAPCPAATVLPPSGLLSFFYDMVNQPWGHRPSERRRWRVLHTPGDVSLRRVERPPSGLTEAAQLGPVTLAALPTLTLPDHLPVDGAELADLVDAGLDPVHVYEDHIVLPDAFPTHQVLGHPRLIQDDPYGVACACVSPWVSLLQLDSDVALGTMFGDVGKLHWFVRLEDLLTRRFDRVALELQCC